MPIYEYECTSCGHHTEALQRFSDSPLTKCKLCHGRLKKLISHSTFHLKGTGWYVTDYASKSGGNDKKSAKSGKQDNGTKSTGSSEASNKKDTSLKGSKETSNNK